jgi:hypothetical protein
MIRDSQDRDRERREITRRKFGSVILRAAGAGLVAPRMVCASDPDFTLAVIPDTQYLANVCSAAFSNMMTWIVNNQSANQGGVFTTNIKAVIGVGDCTHNTTVEEYANAQKAYGILTSSGMSWVNPPGNHDYAKGTDRSAIGSGFGPSGYFGSTARQSSGYYGGLPGGGGRSAWGGSCDNANYYIELSVGSRNILVFSLEHYPRQAVLVWAKGVADANPRHEAILTTHGFMTDTADLVKFSGEPGVAMSADNSGAGLATSQSVSDASFNSGYSIWNNHVTTWSNATIILCGHWIYEPYHDEYGGMSGSWLYQQRPLTSTSPRGQVVQGIFGNWQEADAGNYGGLPGGGGNVGAGSYCPSWPTNAGTARIAHVMLLHFRPSAGKLDGYALSTATGLWEPTWANRATAPSPTPQLLFSVDYTGVSLQRPNRRIEWPPPIRKR